MAANYSNATEWDVSNKIITIIKYNFTHRLGDSNKI